MNRLMMLCNGYLVARARRRRNASRTPGYKLNDLTGLDRLKHDNVVPFRRKPRVETKRNAYTPVGGGNVIPLR